MPRYMVVFTADDGTHANFFEQYATAYGAAQDAAVSLGWYTELYERVTDGETWEYSLVGVI